MRRRSCLYAGRVTHRRLRPVAHRFAYRVLSLHLDLDELEDLDRDLRLFSVDRPNLLSFRAADHGARDGGPLRPWVLAELARAGVRLRQPRITLLCLPRLLGHVFDPLSVFFCHEADRLAAVLYEVRNTLGDKHSYVVPLAAAGDGHGVLRHECAKALYVSPFIGMDATYEVALRPPGERLAISVRERDAEGVFLVASHTGRRVPLTDAAIVSRVVRDPLMTLKVTAGLHVEALALWLKGAPRHPRVPYDAGRA